MLNTIDGLRELIEEGLAEHLPASRLEGAGELNRALRAAVFPGGKRMRPLFTLLGARLAGGSAGAAVPAACAVEFLHTSSLILDDLPAMDDAAVRRGYPALHVRFGESTALLAAIALLNEAYSLFGTNARLIEEATACIGIDGMVGGQAVDLLSQADRSSSFPFEARNRKTSALMRLTFTAGALATNGSRKDIEVLAHAGECLGEAYQICDDLLDQHQECEITGKPARQDERHVRPSHALEFGAVVSMAHATELIGGAKGILEDNFGHRREFEAVINFIDRVAGDFQFAAAVPA